MAIIASESLPQMCIRDSRDTDQDRADNGALDVAQAADDDARKGAQLQAAKRGADDHRRSDHVARDAGQAD